jgi:hypothetical protein
LIKLLNTRLCELKRNLAFEPIVTIAREECTSINVEQLASTRAISAIVTALAVIESPGHP